MVLNCALLINNFNPIKLNIVYSNKDRKEEARCKGRDFFLD